MLVLLEFAMSNTLCMCLILMFQWKYFPLWASSWSSTSNTRAISLFSISPCLCWNVSSSIATSFVELSESWWGEVFEFEHLAKSKNAIVFLICSPYIATLTAGTQFQTSCNCNCEKNLLLKWDTATWISSVLCTIILITMEILLFYMKYDLYAYDHPF